MTNPVHLLAFGFGAGLSRAAPGTCGTLVGVCFAWLLGGVPVPLKLGLIVALFAAGVSICGRCGRDLGVADHAGIVWDEVVGYLVTVALFVPTWPLLIAGFLLFRLFDIAKPWPIGWLDRKVAGGFGVMLDDAVAGLAAAAVLTPLTLFGLGIDWAGWGR